MCWYVSCQPCHTVKDVCSDAILCFLLVYFSCVGGVQPLVPQLLHATVDQAEQPLPALPARVGRAEIWKLILWTLLYSLFYTTYIVYKCVCNTVCAAAAYKLVKDDIIPDLGVASCIT